MKTNKEIGILQDMIELYCEGMKHDMPCSACRELFSYAKKKSLSCPHEDAKIFCSVCKTHCYDVVHRERIREVMRYSSRRYFLKHPMRTISHGIAFLKERRKKKTQQNPGTKKRSQGFTEKNHD